MDHSHLEKIVDQFSRQAIPFIKVPTHMDAIELLLEMSQVGATDTVLDVACGPGLVACEFAPHCSHVTGMDVTPAMLTQAEQRQREKGLTNLAWVAGDVSSLPFADNSFSLVITRYSFHHFQEPARVLEEMLRVCQPGGRILVADVCVKPECSEAYDRMEIMRDPSHTHALTTVEFEKMFNRADLLESRRSAYDAHLDMETLLKASFPKPGDADRLREMIGGDIGVNKLGINAHRKDGAVLYSMPIAVYVGRKA